VVLVLVTDIHWRQAVFLDLQLLGKAILVGMAVMVLAHIHRVEVEVALALQGLQQITQTVATAVQVHYG
jgi:hypothetical protein